MSPCLSVTLLAHELSLVVVAEKISEVVTICTLKSSI